jgi:hypothetical protein
MSDEKGMPRKDGPSSNTRTGSGRDDTYTSSRCCADCGSKAIWDGRDEYTLCSCSSDSEWVNDGRGGYHVGGQLVTRDDDHR